MTEDDLRQFLADNQADILKEVKAKTIGMMAESVKWKLPDLVGEVVTEFVKTDIVPEVRKHLTENKGPIVEAAIKAASQIGDQVAEALVTKAVKVMSESYSADTVIKALMGVR